MDGNLSLCPFDVALSIAQGPRYDVHVSYVVMQWVETLYPIPPEAYLPAFWCGPEL